MAFEKGRITKIKISEKNRLVELFAQVCKKIIVFIIFYICMCN